MQKRIVAIVGCAVLGLGLAGRASGGPLEDGMAAFHSGDYVAAQRILLPLAEHGNATAQAYVGEIYIVGNGDSQDAAKGRALLEQSASQGTATAQYLLGFLYASGTSVPKDYAIAAQWYRKAADQGDQPGSDEAQLLLGRLYAAGLGVPKDLSQSAFLFGKAAKNFQLASKRGDIRSKRQLASMYNRGEGVVRDPKMANRLYGEVGAEYRRHADLGEASAQYKLGQLYAAGHGYPPNRLMAIIWYRKAADQGHTQAQLHLGLHYGFGGDGADFVLGAEPADYVQAYVWLSLAVSGLRGDSHDVVARTRDQMAAHLEPTELRQAQRLVEAWRPQVEAPRAAVARNGADPSAIPMTFAQQAEADRLVRKWYPTPAQIEAEEALARQADMTMGSPNAKIVIVEYASLSGPHSAEFNNDVLPQFKAKYIDTGKVRYIFREFTTPPEEVARGGFLIARCAGKNRYFEVIDAIFKQQRALVESHDFAAGLASIAKSAGLSDDQIQACLANATARRALISRIETFIRRDHINGAPTFVIGGQVLDGRQTLDQLDAEIAKATQH